MIVVITMFVGAVILALLLPASVTIALVFLSALAALIFHTRPRRNP